MLRIPSDAMSLFSRASSASNFRSSRIMTEPPRAQSFTSRYSDVITSDSLAFSSSERPVKPLLQLGRLAGSCYLFLGHPERAEPILKSTAEALHARPKTRALVLGNLALAYLRQRQLDAATATLHEAIDLLEDSRGGGGLTVVFSAGRELYPWRAEPAVQEVHDRLLALVARA